MAIPAQSHRLTVGELKAMILKMDIEDRTEIRIWHKGRGFYVESFESPTTSKLILNTEGSTDE